MDDSVSMEDLKLKQELIQRKILTTLEGLKKKKEEKSSEEVLSLFKREIEDWLEELEGVSFGMEEHLAARGEAEALAC